MTLEYKVELGVLKKIQNVYIPFSLTLNQKVTNFFAEKVENKIE